MTISKKIQTRNKKRQQLFARMVEMKKMVWGSYCKIHVKCGKKYCKCSKGQLHPHQRMSWNEKGKSFSRAVPKEDREWIKAMTDNYREFKQMRREITKLENEIKELLDSYEEFLVNKTRKGKSYLEVWKS